MIPVISSPALSISLVYEDPSDSFFTLQARQMNSGFMWEAVLWRERWRGREDLEATVPEPSTWALLLLGL